MTPAQFTAALATIGWSKRQLSKRLKCNTNLPSWWADGRVPVPSALAGALGRLAAFHELHPLPTNWRKQPKVVR